MALELSIIPRPNITHRLPGNFRLAPGTTIAVTGLGARPAANYLRGILGRATRFPLALGATPGAPDTITLDLDSLSATGDEGYILHVEHQRAQITARGAPGLIYGVQTFYQLFPPAIFSDRSETAPFWECPCVEITDSPRFPWRGAHLDVARHFFPIDTVRRFVDLLALHKLNTLHLHLTDDQGWRFEVPRYPRLTDIGAYRKYIRPGGPNQEDGAQYGGFYTKADLTQLVDYSARRGITVLPEVDVPGHSQAAIAAYPELGNSPESPFDVATTWGISEHVLNVEDATLDFVKNVFTEVLEVFPSPFIHVGGDECPKGEWKSSERAQARMRLLGLRDEDQLQSWFVGELGEFLRVKGRRLIGWDEISEGGLPEGAAVMAWRDAAEGVAAAKAGHDVVMTPITDTYFWFAESDDPAEPMSATRKHGTAIPLQRVYNYEPVPKALDSDSSRRVLGTQGQLWSEYIETEEQLQYMAFPRLCALAEVAWSPPRRSWSEFRRRLTAHLLRLDNLGVHYRPLDALGDESPSEILTDDREGK